MTKTQNPSKRRLTLSRETLRTLTPSELQLVAGGAPVPTRTCGC